MSEEVGALGAILVIGLVFAGALLGVPVPDLLSALDGGAQQAGGANYTVEIERVIDGDTMELATPIVYEGEEYDTVRLVGVDTPETPPNEVEPSDWEFEDTSSVRDCMKTHAEEASSMAKSYLDGKTVRIEFDSESDNVGRYGRLIVYVYNTSVSFNQKLVISGDARVTEEYPFSNMNEYLNNEEIARQNNKGTWDCGQ